MKQLPKIYHGEINKDISNNMKSIYAVNETKEEKIDTDIETFINNLFKEEGYIFNKPLIIKTKDKELDTAIIQKKNNIIYTLTDDVIDIKDIISIKKK